MRFASRLWGWNYIVYWRRRRSFCKLSPDIIHYDTEANESVALTQNESSGDFSENSLAY